MMVASLLPARAADVAPALGIAALDLANLTFRHQNNHDFVLVRIAKSKTDQLGIGTTVAVPRLSSSLRRVCAVVAVER